MRQLENEETRKKLNLAMDNVCKKENVPIINTLIEKRNQVALMLGYSSNAAMTMEGRMAENVENVEKLLDDLTYKITPQGKKEMQEIKNFKKSFEGQDSKDFNTWDWTYYVSKFDEKKNGFEESTVTEYFQAEFVK